MPNAHGASPVSVQFGDDLGLLHEVVVTGNKIGVGRSFYARLAHDEKFFRKVVAFNDVSDDGKSPLVSLMTARTILGSRKVYAGARVAKKWNVELGGDLSIRYSEADLQNAALDNASGKADWRLVRILGLWSLRELHAWFGIDPKSQPCFYKDGTWWLGTAEDKWATRRPVPGYYLLDFHGKWGSTSWDAQEVHIKASGPDFERADEAVLVEAVLTIFRLTSERLLERWCHWGPTLSSDGDRVYVGSFSLDGLYVYRSGPSFDDGDDLRVVRSRKFRS